jgi:membrane protein
VGPETHAYAWLHRSIQDLGVEAATTIMGQVDSLLQHPQPQVANLVSLVALLWAGMRLFETVERSLTEIWPGRVVRNFLSRKAVSFAAMVTAGLLLGSVVLFNAALAAARPWLQRLPGLEDAPLDLLRPRFTLAFGFITSALAFTLLYKHLPVQPVRTRAALMGGLFAALLWFAVSPIFTFMINRTNRYSIVYGSLGGVVIFSLWALLGAQVLLVGAHFTAMYEHVFLHRRGPGEDDGLLQPPTLSREWALKRRHGGG